MRGSELQAEGTALWRPQDGGGVGLVFKARGTGVSEAWIKWGAGRGGSGRALAIRGRVKGFVGNAVAAMDGFGLMDSTAQVTFQEVVLTTGCGAGGRGTGTEQGAWSGDRGVWTCAMGRKLGWIWGEEPAAATDGQAGGGSGKGIISREA